MDIEKAYVSLAGIKRQWLHRYKRKLQKNADADDAKIVIEPRKDKGSLSSKERRELGLHKINRFDKTFKMFLPVHKIWLQYARKYLSLSRHKKNGWRGKGNEDTTVNIQNLIRRIEYFGCFIRVTESRCSEYIGIVGIVLRETKNTFMLICPDNKVKTIPKHHSEFSFVVDNVGFSILGNHLSQRPSGRAKHTFKKHCLWL